jgi:ferredoxin
MTFIITSLCVRDGGCVTVCPVECIVPGKPQDRYPLYYIDPETCIDCGACVRECPVLAIYPEDEVPTAFKAKGGERLSMPAGTPGFDDPYDLLDFNSKPIHLENTRVLMVGELVDLTPDIRLNYDFFESGPGYDAVKAP